MRILGINSFPFHTLSYTIGSSTPATLPFCQGIVDSLPDGLEAMIATGDLQGVAPSRKNSRSGAFLGEALADELQLLQSTGELPPANKIAILLTGDLQPSAGTDDVLGVWQSLGITCAWIAGVAGNHDEFGDKRERTHGPPTFKLPSLHFFDDQVEQIGSMLIAGISGIVGNTCEPWVRSDAEFKAVVERLVREAPEVLLMHDGPNVAGTDLGGWPSVRRVLEAAAECIVFRGHDAWQTVLATLPNGTQVVNVEGRVLVLRGANQSP